MKTKPCLFILLLLWSFATNLMAANVSEEDAVFKVEYTITSDEASFDNGFISVSYPYTNTLYFDNFKDAMDYSNYYGFLPHIELYWSYKCRLTAKVTQLRDFADEGHKDIYLSEDVDITVDLMSQKCYMSGNYSFNLGQRTNIKESANLTIFAYDDKTNLIANFDLKNSSTLTIYGGYYYNEDKDNVIYVSSNSNVNIYGGTFYATKDESAGIQLYESHQVKIYNGTFIGNGYGMYIQKHSNLSGSITSIYGGTFEGTQGDWSYGLYIDQDDVWTSLANVEYGDFYGKTTSIVNLNNFSTGESHIYKVLSENKEELCSDYEFNDNGVLIYNHSPLFHARIHKEPQAYVIPWIDDKPFEFISDIHTRWYADWCNPHTSPYHTKLTFMYDGYIPYGAYPIMEFEEINTAGWSPAWIKDQHPENITEVVFHDTFKDYSPTSCYNWFFGCKALRSINLENLKTDKVQDMRSMFNNCISLESVDLSGCNTSKVIDMSYMFFQCEALSSVNLGGKFSTESVKTFNSMFGSCNALIELDLSSFDTKSLNKDDHNYHNTMTYMINGLANLKVIKLGSKFKPVGDLLSFAPVCTSLETILVDKDYTCNPSDFNTYGQLFNLDTKLRGGNGTQCTSEHWGDEEYFRIDRKDTPGFLTTLPYTFKCVDDNGIAFLDSFYYPSNKDISFFENNVSKVITLREPEARKGYAFIGWSDSLNIDYSKDKIVKSVAFSTDTARCNRIYKANYKKRITAEVANKASYPDPERLELFCNGKESTIALPYKITYGNDNVIGFELHINNDEYFIADRITDDDTLFINNVPNIPTGVYDAELVFIGNFDLENNPDGVPNSDPYPITLTVNNVQDAAVQLYTDVLIADNHSGVYSAYQWYRDGEPIQGANEQYYVDKFDYSKSYSVKLSGNGEDIMSCPVKWLSTAKVLSPSVKVYPNPAKENEFFTLEILDYDSEQSYDIVIFTANGTLVKKISNVEKQTSVSLPTGIYSGSLISGDDKKGFKIIVK